MSIHLTLFSLLPSPPSSFFPYTTLFRSSFAGRGDAARAAGDLGRPRSRSRLADLRRHGGVARRRGGPVEGLPRDRKSTRLNSSHLVISYAVFCLKKKSKL